MASSSLNTDIPQPREARGRTWFARAEMLGAVFCLLFTGCQSSAVLRDDEELPIGSRVEFWVYHDDLEWVESNIHIAYLPRPMTGLETRLWADGVGKRDADMRWTHYRVVAHFPQKPRFTYRSRIYPRSYLLKRELVPGTEPPPPYRGL